MKWLKYLYVYVKTIYCNDGNACAAQTQTVASMLGDLNQLSRTNFVKKSHSKLKTKRVAKASGKVAGITQAPHAYLAFASAASALALMTLASINQRVKRLWNILWKLKYFKDTEKLWVPLLPAQLYTWEMALVAPALVTNERRQTTFRLWQIFTDCNTAFAKPWLQLLFWSLSQEIWGLRSSNALNPHLIPFRLVHTHIRRWDLLKNQPRQTRRCRGQSLEFKA